MAGGNDMPQISHRERLLSPQKGKEDKMALPDYGEGMTSCNREREVTRQKLWPKENQP